MNRNLDGSFNSGFHGSKKKKKKKEDPFERVGGFEAGMAKAYKKKKIDKSIWLL